MPVAPLALLRRRGDVTIHTYAETAERLGLTEDQFERRCGAADAFTLRQVSEKGVRYAVSYRANGNPARMNFTLAHELGHIVLQHMASSAAEEREADHFASCLLCPAPLTKGEKDPAVLAKKCYVSLTAAKKALDRPALPVNEALLAALAQKISTNEGCKRDG